MNKTHEDYVSFEQAKALKELEFDWEVVKGYSHFPGEKIKTFNAQEENVNAIYSKWCFAAPSLYQTQKWLREVKKLDIDITLFRDIDARREPPKIKRYYNCEIAYSEDSEDLYEDFDSYEEALSSGINKALELLKQQSNNNQKKCS